MRTKAGFALAIVAWLAGCGEPPPPADAEVAPEHLPFFESRSFTPQWLDPADVPSDFHHIPAFSLTDHRGESVDESALDGRVVVADFFFASCSGICPRLRKSMVSIDAAFPDDADLVLLSHSVTPSKDTVAVLADYAQRHDITSPRWHLMTGDRDTIYRLGRDAYFAEEDLGEPKADVDFMHTENIVLLDRHRRVRGVYSGINKTAVAQLIEDARRLMREAP